MAIKKQYKLRYTTSDDKVFDDLKEAEAHEKELGQIKKRYHVTFTVKADCYVEALNEDEAADYAEDGWATGKVEFDEEIIDIITDEEW